MRGTLVRGVRLSFYTPRLRTVQRSRAPHHSCLTRGSRRLTHVGCCGCQVNTRLQLESAPSVAPAVIAVRVSDVVCCDAPNQRSAATFSLKQSRRTRTVASPDFTANGHSTPQGNCCPSRSESERG